MSVIKLVTDRETLPITVEDAKSYLKIDNAADDHTLSLLISAAADIFEDWTNRVLLTKTFQAYFFSLNECLQMRRAPFQSMVSLQYLVNGVWTTYDPANYTIDQDDNYAKIFIVDGAFIPSIDNVPSAVSLTWKAGYGDKPNAIPSQMLITLLQLIAFLNENRGDYDQGDLPKTLEMALNRHKIRSVAIYG